jgi:hypothetical protein
MSNLRPQYGKPVGRIIRGRVKVTIKAERLEGFWREVKTMEPPGPQQGTGGAKLMLASK